MGRGGHRREGGTQIGGDGMMATLEKIRRDALSDPLYFTKMMAKDTTFGTTLFDH